MWAEEEYQAQGQVEHTMIKKQDKAANLACTI